MAALLKLSALLKIPELLIAMVVMILARCGNQDSDSYYLGWVDPKSNLTMSLASGDMLTDIIRIDAQNFCAMVGYGYVFILIVMLISMLGGDKSRIQNLLFCFCGFIFYISLGALRIKYTEEDSDDEPTKLAIGSMAIINGLVFLADTGVAALALKNKHDD